MSEKAMLADNASFSNNTGCPQSKQHPLATPPLCQSITKKLRP